MEALAVGSLFTDMFLGSFAVFSAIAAAGFAWGLPSLVATLSRSGIAALRGNATDTLFPKNVDGLRNGFAVCGAFMLSLAAFSWFAPVFATAAAVSLIAAGLICVLVIAHRLVDSNRLELAILCLLLVGGVVLFLSLMRLYLINS